MSNEQPTATKLPLKLMVAFSGKDGDFDLYEVTLEVPGNSDSKLTTTIAFDPEVDGFAARVVRPVESLPDRLLLSFFKWGYATMTQADGSAVEWWLSDITRLSARWFDPSDVSRLSELMASSAHAAVEVEDMMVVRVD